MTPSSEDVFILLSSNQLGRVLRGEVCVFPTPAHINDDMRPTDHDELLSCAIYPLAQQYGVDLIRRELERAIQDISIDAMGLFCAIQCFYIQIVREDSLAAAFRIDRKNLPRYLGNCFIREANNLHYLEVRPGDAAADRPYRITLSRMRILNRDHGIDWGIIIPKL